MGEKKQSKRTEIADLGEFGLIDHLTKNIELRNKSSRKGVGDDAAIIGNTGDEVKLVTTDMLVEGIHFDLSYHPLQHLGYKSIIVNLSDIYAMNARPEQVLVSIGLSNRFSVEAVEMLYEGMLAACDKHDVDMVGGDTCASRKGLIISVTAIGSAREENIATRSGAEAGDLIAVSGDLGGAYFGLQMLEREKQVYMDNPDVQPDLEQEKYIVGRQLLPEARKDVIEIFEELNICPSAMIDISDGLSSDILHICKNSGVGCVINEDDLPIAEEVRMRAAKFSIPSSTAALNGGEDYELLFTFPEKHRQKIESMADFTIIGRITKPKDGFKLKSKSGQLHDLQAQGWKHI